MRTIARSLLIMVMAVPLAGTAQPKNASKTLPPDRPPAAPLITFVELGSVKCIPCKAMQPVMKAIESKYGEQVKVVFYDVWTPEQAHYAQEFNIRLIPTQVFLDGSGKELMRHEGFFPEKAIDQFLQARGLKPRSGAGM